MQLKCCIVFLTHLENGSKTIVARYAASCVLDLTLASPTPHLPQVHPNLILAEHHDKNITVHFIHAHHLHPSVQHWLKKTRYGTEG